MDVSFASFLIMLSSNWYNWIEKRIQQQTVRTSSFLDSREATVIQKQLWHSPIGIKASFKKND